ncbi:MAG: hypothetical protein ACRDNW_14725 [Trebonia sp.]
MTQRLADDETEALRRRAELEQKSMQEVARQAISEYVENHSRAELLDQVLDEELPATPRHSSGSVSDLSDAARDAARRGADPGNRLRGARLRPAGSR